MKRIIAMVMTALLILSLAGCASSGKGDSASAGKTGQQGADDSLAETGKNKTDDTQMESTVVDETLTGMLKPIDAIMLSELMDQTGFNSNNPEVYWTGMYYYLCFYGDLANGTTYDSEKKEYCVVPEVVKEAGRILFGEMVMTPQIPPVAGNKISLGDDGKYYVKAMDRPDNYPVLVSAVKNKDGSFEVIAQLSDFHGKILSNHSFHLTPKSSVNELLGVKYYYTVRVAGVG